MIYIGIGSNLATAYGGPLATCHAALDRLSADAPVRVAACAPWYRSAPVPVSDQPWFVNGVARLDTALDPAALLAALHRVEAALGRVRRVRDEARGIDLDLLDYDGRIAVDRAPILPHPRLTARAFVLAPLADLAPDWRHPVSGETAAALLARVDPAQRAERIADDGSTA